MDAELAALQRQFSELQEQKSALRLSEANCVEIIGKLVKQGKLRVRRENEKQHLCITCLVWF